MFNIRYYLVMMGIFSFLFGGCSKQPRPIILADAEGQSVKALASPPEVTSEEDEEEGFHDLIFYIQEHKQHPDGSQSVQGQGTHQGRPLALEIVLGPTWKSGSLGKDIPLVTHTGAVTFRSIGSESDSFIQVLDKLYDTQVSSKVMNSETKFAAISLKGDPGNLAKGPVKIKLFFESEKEDEYAELFANIDLSAHRLEICEKDEGYRPSIVKALRAE